MHIQGSCIKTHPFQCKMYLFTGPVGCVVESSDSYGKTYILYEELHLQWRPVGVSLWAYVRNVWRNVFSMGGQRVESKDLWAYAKCMEKYIFSGRPEGQESKDLWGVARCMGKCMFIIKWFEPARKDM